MKVIYSYWSDSNTQNHAGYSNEKMMRMGWSLSVLMANEFYEPILWTDKNGWEFIKPLNLPWKDVRIENFYKYDVPAHLWNFSKIIAMIREEPPFIHVDHDVFLHKPLPEFREMLFQNWEHFQNYNFYKKMVNYVTKNKKFYPLPSSWDKNVQTSLNCGVVGCKSKKFIDLWSDGLLEWISSERFSNLTGSNHLSGEDHLWPAVIEQYLMACTDKKMGEVSQVLFSDFFPNLQKKLNTKGYTHLLAGSKRKKEIEIKLSNFLKTNYPNQYKRIKSLNSDLFI